MEKNFDAWNGVKKSLETRSEKILFKEGDIWWTSLGINIATESCGKGDTFRQPVLIIKKLSGKAAIVIPLTSQEKNRNLVPGNIHPRKSKLGAPLSGPYDEYQ